MAPDQAKGKEKPRSIRNEFEVAYYTRKLGRPLQRELLQRRLDEPSDNGLARVSHGDEPRMEKFGQTPREDRAG